MPKTNLKYNPRNLCRSYGTNIFFKGENKQNQISFVTDIVYAGKCLSYSAFHLSRSNLFINNMQIDDNMYKLAEECNQSFYPITAFIRQDGKLIGIRTDDIVRKWEKAKVGLMKRYNGNVAKEYIEEVENNIKNNESIQKLVENDIFFSVYFRLRFSDESVSSIITPIPLLPFKNSLYCDGFQNVSYENLECKDIIQIIDIGEIIHESESDILPNTYDTSNDINPINGRYKIIYDLNSDSFLIDAIIGEFILMNNGEELQKITLESYHLEDNILLPIEDHDIMQMDKLCKKSETSYWGRFVEFINK